MTCQAYLSQLGKTVRLYRSSTLGRSSRQSGRRSSARTEDDDPRLSSSQHESWEDDSFVRNGMSFQPLIIYLLGEFILLKSLS